MVTRLVRRHTGVGSDRATGGSDGSRLVVCWEQRRRSKCAYRRRGRPTCASRSPFTKPGSRRVDCHPPDRPCSPALRRSSRRTRSSGRSLACTGHDPGRRLKWGRSRSENSGELARQAVAARDGGRRAAARLCRPCPVAAAAKDDTRRLDGARRDRSLLATSLDGCDCARDSSVAASRKWRDSGARLI